MIYIPTHKRKILGTQIHQNIKHKAKKTGERGNKTNIMPCKPKAAEVAPEYIVPEVRNWVETEQVKNIKERIKAWLFLKYPVHIVGPTGCGKTALALQIAKELNRPTVWINGDESVTTTDLIGGYSQVEASTIRDKYIHNCFKDKEILKADWVDNPLTLACKYGYTLIYNEFIRSKASANNVLLSIFSEGILELPTQFGEERYIKIHPDFRAIFTSNSIEYAGVHRAQDALLDRMIGIYMDYYDKKTEAKIISSQSGIDEKQAIPIIDMLKALREGFPEDHIGTRGGVMVASALNSANRFDKPSIKQFLADVITSKTKNAEDLAERLKLIERL